jgi:hypothetical protein
MFVRLDWSTSTGWAGWFSRGSSCLEARKEPLGCIAGGMPMAAVADHHLPSTNLRPPPPQHSYKPPRHHPNTNNPHSPSAGAPSSTPRTSTPSTSPRAPSRSSPPTAPSAPTPSSSRPARPPSGWGCRLSSGSGPRGYRPARSATARRRCSRRGRSPSSAAGTRRPRRRCT